MYELPSARVSSAGEDGRAGRMVAQVRSETDDGISSLRADNKAVVEVVHNAGREVPAEASYGRHRGVTRRANCTRSNRVG